MFEGRSICTCGAVAVRWAGYQDGRSGWARNGGGDSRWDVGPSWNGRRGGDGKSEAALEEDVATLASVFDTFAGNAAAWFPRGDDAEHIVELINARAGPWEEAYRALLHDLGQAAKNRAPVETLTERADAAEAAINVLNDYVVDLQESARQPNYAEARDNLVAFFQTLLPPGQSKKARPDKKKQAAAVKAPRARRPRSKTDVARGCSKRTGKQSGASCIRAGNGRLRVGRCGLTPAQRRICRPL